MSTWKSEMTTEEWQHLIEVVEILCFFCGGVMEQWDEDEWVCPKGCGIPCG